MLEVLWGIAYYCTVGTTCVCRFI